MNSSFLARAVRDLLLVSTIAIAGCRNEVEVPVEDPVRNVVPHALVTHDSGIRIAIHIFDAPVGCDAIPRGIFSPVTPGVRLQVVIPLDRWEPGVPLDITVTNWMQGGIWARSFDATGQADRFGYGTVRWTHEAIEFPVFELLSAPRAKGSRGRARLEARIVFKTAVDSNRYVRIDEIASEFEIEVCDDIEAPPTPPGG